MPNKIIISGDPTRFSALTLEQLVQRAENFGLLRIHSSDSEPLPNRYRATIEFNSIPGVRLEAGSEFYLPIKVAVMQAIDRAEQIAASYSAKANDTSLYRR